MRSASGVSCPAKGAVRDGSRSAQPDVRRRTTDEQVCRPSSVVCLLNHIRQQPEKAGALDGARKLALLERRYRRDTARPDLAALGNGALQQAYGLVADFRRIAPGERTCLAPGKERAPCPAAPPAQLWPPPSPF